MLCVLMRSFHMPVRKWRLKGLQVSNVALLWVVFRWHHGSEAVKASKKECSQRHRKGEWKERERSPNEEAADTAVGDDHHCKSWSWPNLPRTPRLTTGLTAAPGCHTRHTNPATWAESFSVQPDSRRSAIMRTKSGHKYWPCGVANTGCLALTQAATINGCFSATWRT